MSVAAPRGRETDPLEERFNDPGRGFEQGTRWSSILLICLGLIVLSVAAAVLVERRHETTYGGRSEIVLIVPSDTSDDSRERLVKTQSEVLGGQAVLEPVARERGISTGELREKISIDTALRSDVLTITATDADRSTAQRLAAAVAERYLELSRRLVPESDEGEALVQRRIQESRRELARASGDETFAIRDRINRLQEWVLELQVEALDRPRARLLTEAYVMDEPLRPKPSRAAAGGLAIGLLLAAAVALILRRWRLGPRA